MSFVVVKIAVMNVKKLILFLIISVIPVSQLLITAMNVTQVQIASTVLVIIILLRGDSAIIVINIFHIV